MNLFDTMILAIAALGIAGFGAMWFVADGMDPTGQKSGIGGCLTTLVGLGLFGTMIWLAIRHL
jgi:hypothetical protein